MSVKQVWPSPPGCPQCDQLMSGDCGQHGPRIVIGSTMFPLDSGVRAIESELHIEVQALRAQVAALQAERDKARKGWTLEQAQAQVRDFNIVCDEVRKHRSRAEAAEQRIAATVAWLEAEQRQRCDTWPVPADDILARLAATECTGEK